jgi:hypothetical protein
MSGWSDLQAADANIASACALAVTFINAAGPASDARVAAAIAGDDAKAEQFATDFNAAASAVLAALPTPADPGTTPAQLAAAQAAVAPVVAAAQAQQAAAA